MHGASGRAVAALSAVTAFLLLAPGFVLIPSASSDPTVVDHGDMTKSVFWNFTEPADYLLHNSSISGGVGMLSSVNETDVENTSAQYLLGARTNLDLQTFPDEMAVDNTDLAVQTSTIQPGPEGIDCWLQEWFSDFNPDGTDLELNGDYDPDPFHSNRARIVMQFNLSAIPAEATIWNATLWLYQQPSKPGTVYYSVHALNSSFVETEVSWTHRDAAHPWITLGGDFSTEAFSNGTVEDRPGWHAFDLTRLVDLWVGGRTPNYGFIIVAKDATVDQVKKFVCSDITNKPEQRPKLVVNYTYGQAVGEYRSRALGPGTNTTFTLASWHDRVISKATDEFDAGNISSRWKWARDPCQEGGSVNFDRVGWLNITGSQLTELTNTTLGCNYLHQTITGDFRAETSLDEHFTESSMGAGLLMKSDNMTWLALYKSGLRENGSVVAKVRNGGVSTTLGSILWAGSTAFLRIDRSNGTYQLAASTDGNAWNQFATYTPTYDFTRRVLAGLCVFSGMAPSNPVVEFDFFRIQPLEQNTILEMRVRTGNSTDLSDPSWQPWGTAIGPGTGAVLGLTGRYLQYRVTMMTGLDWISPAFSEFRVWNERYLSEGTITTSEVAPLGLRTWESLAINQSATRGSVEYLYSTDHGGTWSSLGFGTSFALLVSEPSMMLRMVIRTQDTLATPTIDSIELVYRIWVGRFYVTAPSSVVAGEPFPVTVEAKDTANRTTNDWTGTVTLHAMDAAGISNASSELVVRQASVPLSGFVTVPDEQYTFAETIRILATGAGAFGLSSPITVLPGPLSSISISPDDTRMEERTSKVFTATAYDAFGNVIPNAAFSWSVDSSLGTINRTSGPSVLLTVCLHLTSGYLRVSSGGVSTSRFIEVYKVTEPPVIAPGIDKQTKLEDSGEWVLDPSPFVSDPDSPSSELKWFTTNESIVRVYGENETGNLVITFSTIENLFGSTALRLTVVDPDGNRNSTTIPVEIVPVNDAPVIDHIDPLVVHYDIPYVFDFTYYVHDVDNARSELSLGVDPGSSQYCLIDGLRIAFTYPKSMVNTNQTVIVVVRDKEPLSGATAVIVRVTDDRPPEQKLVLPSFTLYQGTTLADCVYLPTYFVDPDGDVLYYAHGNVHVIVTIKANRSVDLTAPSDWHGVEYVIFQAIDPEGARAEGVMPVTVLFVNRPPVISGVPDLMVRYNEPFDFDVGPYVTDPDEAFEEFSFAADDLHCSFIGSVMTVLYPASMNNTRNRVNITVSDGELLDWWAINVTVSDNHPPRLAPGRLPPDHSFQEDAPTPYPIDRDLGYYFDDEDASDSLEFSARSLSVSVVATVSRNSTTGAWRIGFVTTPNYYGTSGLTIRATDSRGAIFERTIAVRVISVPDAPVLQLPASLEVTEGTQMVFSLAQYITDPDSSIDRGDFEFEVRIGSQVTAAQDYLEHMTVLPGMIVFRYPKGFAEGHGTEFTIEIRVTDQDGKMATDTMSIELVKAPAMGNDQLWMVALALAGGASGMAAIAWARRKRPFVIRDLMIVHNDGFLMERYARQQAGEIDQDVLSGMLTAVLNFVEDSMATSGDSLKTFGFREYEVIVKRGSKIFAAVVHEGDVPKDIDKALADLVAKIERIYKKKIASWTGDIETDFAGLEALIQAFVKEHSRRPRRGSMLQRIWVAKGGGKEGPGQPMTK
ncbi:MAG: DNRLRE domain-containing protein [Thermoplasmata archaeon]